MIVGAGPTGLALAVRLAQAGVPCVIVEAEPGLTHDLRAGSFHPPTIEMLNALGVGEEILRRGLKVPVWQIRDRLAGIVAEFDLSILADVTPFPYRLHLEQHKLTPILLDRLRATHRSADVRFSTTVASVNDDGAGVNVALSDGKTLRASFVVGCDGARSAVRGVLGIAFEGFTWPERFLVASTTCPLQEWGFSGAGYIADPEHWAAVFHVPDEGPPGLWRIAYGTDPQEPEESVLAQPQIQTRLRIILGNEMPDVEFFPLKYASTYRVHQRVAERFARGRIAIAGDAAHINNPLGGFGLNGSIHDAMNLAEKLIAVWGEGTDHQALFDRYDRQRRPINIKAVQAMSIRNKKLLEERDPKVRQEALDEMRAIAADPGKARAFLMNSSMINSVREAAATA